MLMAYLLHFVTHFYSLASCVSSPTASFAREPLRTCAAMEVVAGVHAGWGWSPPVAPMAALSLPPAVDVPRAVLWLVGPSTVPPDVFLAVERCSHLPAPAPWPSDDGAEADILNSMSSAVEAPPSTRPAGRESNGVEGNGSPPGRKRS